VLLRSQASRTDAPVCIDNPSFMRFFVRLGFTPFVVRVERRRLFRRRVDFLPLEPHVAGELVKARDPVAATRLRLAGG
jgi:hypothetical protein